MNIFNTRFKKKRYQPSLFCIRKKLITQSIIHRTLCRICSQWHKTYQIPYTIDLDDILRYRLMLKLYNSWPSQTHAQSLCNTLFQNHPEMLINVHCVSKQAQIISYFHSIYYFRIFNKYMQCLIFKKKKVWNAKCLCNS